MTMRGGVAVAVEKAVTQIPSYMEPRLEGLNLWFDHAMDRASQRFTLQARVITMVLSLVLVFAAHLDAIRLFQMLSSDAQVRAQLAGSADAMIKQAEQLPRARDGAGLQATREVARSIVPGVYRNAMVAVLEPTPATTEQTKPKSRHTSHSIAAPPPGGSQPLSSGGSAVLNDIQISTSVPPEGGIGSQYAPAIAQTLTETSPKERENRSATPTRPKSVTKQPQKSGGAPREDDDTMEAKVRVSKALEARPGFASREDAVLWLRATLDGDPALENLAVAYDQEVNTELIGDADKLIDHSASIDRQLARNEFQPLPEKWMGWKPTEQELPGLLVAVVFLCLGAPFCYNMLKVIASLRPLPTMKQDKEA